MRARTIARALALGSSIVFLGACSANLEWGTYDGHGQAVFPQEHWAKIERPEELGWSSGALVKARVYSREIGSTAVMIVHDGVVVSSWGKVAKQSELHSVRKSLLSGLIGRAVDNGQIDLSSSLELLGIDDNEPSLTDDEKQATVGDLIKSRSGIYHAALYETRQMTASKPARGSSRPGQNWHYNNWDFNALGTIYEKLTDQRIFEAFEAEFARPLQMEDFDASDGRYVTGKDSIHAAYPIRMSARDLARFALLYLRNDRWMNEQIISADWVRESTQPHTEFSPERGYGYMWWTGLGGELFKDIGDVDDVFYASGYGTQVAWVFPKRNLVIVHRKNTRFNGLFPAGSQIYELLSLILAAAPKT